MLKTYWDLDTQGINIRKETTGLKVIADSLPGMEVKEMTELQNNINS